MNSFVTFFALAACFVSSAYGHAHGTSSAVYQDNFLKKVGQKENVEWDAASKMNDEVRAEVCSSIHAMTGHGPAKMKQTEIQEAYLKFDNKRYKPIFTKVLMCKQDNKKEHTYYVTQGLDKGSVSLIHPNNKQLNGKNVFHFTWSVDQVRNVPMLVKMNGA